MECFQQKDFRSDEELMEILGRMGENLTISARLWKNGSYTENKIKNLRAWIKTIKKIEDKMAFNLGL
jgi:hypothetical protein